ncbi:MULTISPECIES: hypothetical protein [unclassified Haloparvum]
MSSDGVGTFECQNCDVTAASTQVPYDDLGYAVCPFCRQGTAPRRS